jgi:sulfonate dioxygenase
VGLKKEESGKSGFGFRGLVSELKLFEDAILNLLYDHIEKSADSQVRLKWEPETVVIWDNRLSTHV